MRDFYTETEEIKIAELAKDGIIVEWLSGLCPVQGDGWIDKDHAFFFRARHSEWTMSITEGKANDLDEALDDEGVWEYDEDYGKDPEAGYMPFIEALGFIEKSAKLFRAHKESTR